MDMEDKALSGWRLALTVAVYSLACGVLLTIFSFMTSWLKFAFSIGALLLGMRFFRRVDKTLPRVLMVVFSILIYFVAAFIFVVVQYIQTEGLPAA